MKIPFLLAAVVVAAFTAQSAQAADKIALVVKSLGNGFFDAANQGAQEAAKELKDVEIIYTGPAKATAEGQIEIINSLIAQNVKAIVISANDPDALVPSLKKAMARGIKVISFDSGVSKDGRDDASEPVVQRAHRREAGQDDAGRGRRERRDRGAVGYRAGDEPEHLDRRDEEGSRAAGLLGPEAGQRRLRR